MNEDEKLCVPRLPGGPAGSNCWWGRNSGTDTSRDGDDDISHNDDDDSDGVVMISVIMMMMMTTSVIMMVWRRWASRRRIKSCMSPMM